MDGFWKFLGLAVAAAVIALTLRSANKPFGLAFALAAGAALLLALTEPLREAVRAVGEIAQAAGAEDGRLTLIVRILGVAFAAEFAAQACRDAGEEGIALRVELSAKLALVALSAPLLRQMAGLIRELTA